MPQPRRKLHVRRLLRLVLIGSIAVLFTLSGFYTLRITALRSRVLDDFRALAENSYYHLFAEPHRVRVGTDARATGIVSRLQRAGYTEVQDRPDEGEFALRRGSIQFRHRPSLYKQDDRLVSLRLDGPVVADIRVGDEEFEWIELPPEHLTSFRRSIYERRSPVRYHEIHPSLIAAVLAAEDRRFFQHPGLDGRGIARAALRNLRHRRIVEGGSTITQQVVKALLNRTDRKLHRKFDEALLALSLERNFSKQEILQVYLNEVYLGQEGPFRVHGVAEAARFFYGKPLGDLDDIEHLDLAAAIRAPNAASPKRNPARLLNYSRSIARARADVFVPEARHDSTLVFRTLPNLVASAICSERVDFDEAQMGYYFDLLKREWNRAQRKYRLEAPAVLYTAIDPQLQFLAARSLDRGLLDAYKRSPRGDEQPLQGAIAVVDPESGGLRALVGGTDHITAPFNRAVDAVRPVGSTFKPMVYLAALGGRRYDATITQSTWLPDEERTYKVGRQLWKPANFDGTYRGWVTARTALSQSINAATVALGMDVGVKRVGRLAQAMGLRDEIQPNPSILLGAVETSPVRLSGAYAALANGGHKVTPQALTALQVDGRSISLLQQADKRVLDPRACYVVTDMLLGAMQSGTGRTVRKYGFDHLATGKTGTTDGSRDCWFVGYTPEIVATVWVGYDDNSPTGLTGSKAALPIWARLLRDWLGEGWDQDFDPPPGIAFRRVDAETGELANRSCPRIDVAAFIDEQVPLEGCSVHGASYRDRYERYQAQRDDEENRERWLGLRKKRGLWNRVKDALGV